MAKQVTAFDVAQRAGVSQGTVDRVIHNRGEVSAKTKEKVMAAIEELGFKVNAMASALAKRKDIVFACLIPSFRTGEYWEMIYNGFTRSAGSVSAMGISTRTFFYDQHDAESFVDASQQVLECNPAGVVIAPLFSAESQQFSAVLDEHGIPYVFVDTRVDNTNYLAYFGMPAFKSGYLCGAMLMVNSKHEKVREVAVVRLKREADDNSGKTQSRSKGFAQFMSEYFPDCRIITFDLTSSDPSKVSGEISNFFVKHKDIKHIAFLNSRIYLISKYLADTAAPRHIVGYDSLPQNMDMLREGLISALIAQHAEEQSRMAVDTLANFILMHKRPAKRDNNMHMDILTRYNCEDYE